MARKQQGSKPNPSLSHDSSYCYRSHSHSPLEGSWVAVLDDEAASGSTDLRGSPIRIGSSSACSMDYEEAHDEDQNPNQDENQDQDQDQNQNVEHGSVGHGFYVPARSVYSLSHQNSTEFGDDWGPPTDEMADLALDSSLSALMTKGKGTRRRVKSKDSDDDEDDSTEIDFQFTRREPRVRLSTVRIISSEELKEKQISKQAQDILSTSASSADDTIITTTRKPRSRKKKRNNSSSPPFTNPTTMTYLAGISVVAGLSFGAGYAIGRRSGSMRVVS